MRILPICTSVCQSALRWWFRADQHVARPRTTRQKAGTLTNPKRYLYSPNRHIWSVPVPFAPWTPWQPAWHLPRRPAFALPSEVPGLTARRIAADILDGVLHKHRTLDEQLEGSGVHPGLKTLSDRDRALMRRLVGTILRRLGTLGHVLSRLLNRGIPTDAPRVQSALLIGAAQILWMDVPDHAAVDLSVPLVQADRRAPQSAGLDNAAL